MNNLAKFCLHLAFAALMLTSSMKVSAQLHEENEQIHWYADYDDARKEAMTQDKIVMLYFSGSDWSKPCIQLNKNILETDTFTKYITGNFVPVKLVFPKMRKNRQARKRGLHNEVLVERYNPNGIFPLLVFLDQDEKMIGFTGFSEISPHAYVAVIDKIIHP
jgi:thioredoxin-related protein